MSTVKFNCPECKNPLEADCSMAGDLVDCPNCKKSLMVPARNVSTPISHPLMDKENRVVVVGVEMPFSQVFTITFKVFASVFLLSLIVFVIFAALSFFGVGLGLFFANK